VTRAAQEEVDAERRGVVAGDSMRPRALLVASTFVLGALGVGMAALVLVPAWLERGPELPVLGQVGAFALVDQAGRPFSERSLEGKPWVANFIFSRCPNICPLFTAKLKSVQEAAHRDRLDVRFVSLTVDPEYDVPDVLRAYAERQKLDLSDWSFVTGTRAALRHLIVDELKVHMQRGSSPDDLAAIAHGSHFALVDGNRRIRGYYRFDDAEALEALKRDLRRLR
jgi:protein SCO1